jgi:membrane protease YdiL (CAAX protease family)
MHALAPFALRHQVLSYFVIAYAITYAIDVVAILTLPALFLLGTFGPLISAVLLTRVESGWAGVRELLGRVRRWRLGIGWYAFVLFGPGAVYLLAMALTAALGGTVDVAKIDPWYTVPLLFLLVLFVGGPLGEEFGWRGYALPRLQERRSTLAAALILGVVWALWHLPNWWIPVTEQYENVRGNGNYLFFIGEFVLVLVALSVVFAFVYNGTGESMLAPLLLHASFNTWSGWLSRAIDPAARPTFFVCQILLLWTVAILVVIATGPRRLLRHTGPANA